GRPVQPKCETTGASRCNGEVMSEPNIDTTDILVDCQGIWKIFGGRAPAAMAAVREQGLSKQEVLEQYGCVVGVADANMQVHRGEIFCIMGLSGSGKSTLIRLFNRLIAPTAGRVLVKGRDLASLNAAELRQMRAHHIGM